MILYRTNIHDIIFKCYVISVFYIGFIGLFIQSSNLNLLDDLLFLLMFVSFSIHIGRLKRNIQVFFFILPIFLLISCFVAYGNENSVKAILLSLRQYKNVFIVFLLLAINREQVDFVRTTVKWALIFSLPLSVIQFIIYPNADYVTGIFGFGASGTLSLVITFYIATEIALRSRDNRKILDWYLLLLFPVLINETKLTFILLPLCLALLLFFVRKIGAVGFFALLTSALASVLVLDVLYEFLYGRTFTEFFSPENFEVYFFTNNQWDLGRFVRILLAYDYLEFHNDLWIGQGLGASFVGVNSGTYGIAARAFFGTGLNEGSRIQLYHFLIDFGLFGSALFITWLFYVGVSLFKGRNQTEVNICCLAMLVIVLVGLAYQNILTNRVSSFMLFFYVYTSLFQKKQGGK